MDEFVQAAWEYRKKRSAWSDFWGEYGDAIRTAFADNWEFDVFCRRLLGIVLRGEDVPETGAADPMRDGW
jgi:hypothetical protein